MLDIEIPSAEQLTELVECSGMTRASIAALLGVRYGTFGSWANPKRTKPPQSANRMLLGWLWEGWKQDRRAVIVMLIVNRKNRIAFWAELMDLLRQRDLNLADPPGPVARPAPETMEQGSLLDA